MIETKVAAGSFTGIITGLLTWALVAYVPAFRAGLPPPVAALIPWAVAWLAHSAAGYMAPHTPRPAPVSSAPTVRPTGSVTITPPAADRPAGSL